MTFDYPTEPKPPSNANELAHAVSVVMADVLVHQRPRWGTLLSQRRQFEGWWKAEMALALDSWTYRAGLDNPPFGVVLEDKPDIESDQRADLVVGPWETTALNVDRKKLPRVWIELKTRATWWGETAGATAKANQGLRDDLAKWEKWLQREQAPVEDIAVLCCQISAHDGDTNEQMPKSWQDDLNIITRESGHTLLVERSVYFDIQGQKLRRWATFHSFLVTPSTMNEKLDEREPVLELFAILKASLPKLEELLARCGSHWGYEDPVYRYYHQSFKVYRLQDTTVEIVTELQSLAPGRPLNKCFQEIVQAGIGKEFAAEHNRDWGRVTRPILEAFFHARYFLEMAVRYGRKLKQPLQLLPSGWAAFLYLYDLR